MDVGFEILIPIGSENKTIKFAEPVYEWDGVEYPQGPEEAIFYYFKLKKTEVPSHISMYLPSGFKDFQWQCISVADGIVEYERELLHMNEKSAVDDKLMELLRSILESESKWVVAFEPDCDRIDDTLKGDIDLVFKEIVNSLKIEKKGFVIWNF